MAVQATNYQCPQCTGPLAFDANSGKLECEYCSSSFEVAEIEALYAQKNAEAEKAAPAPQPITDTAPQQNANMWGQNKLNDNWGEDAQKMCAYSCTSCGAEIICDQTTAATSCLYCGNPTIIPSQFAGALRPDFIIPFKVSREEAKAALRRHCEGKFLLPRLFKSEAHIEELKGVYVPFWLFDGSVHADVSYSATHSTTHTSGDYRVTTTRHYDVRRTGTVDFRDIPLDASSKMPDVYMESIEPFDYGALKPFSVAYMPGFFADKYDVSIEQCTPRADQRAANTALNIMRSSVSGYSTVIERGRELNLKRGAVEYAMAPVWMLTTRWMGKPYLFAMNGQTGKFVGDLPCHWGKFAGLVAAIAAGLTPIFYYIYTLLLK